MLWALVNGDSPGKAVSKNGPGLLSSAPLWQSAHMPVKSGGLYGAYVGFIDPTTVLPLELSVQIVMIVIITSTGGVSKRVFGFERPNLTLAVHTCRTNADKRRVRPMDLRPAQSASSPLPDPLEENLWILVVWLLLYPFALSRWGTTPGGWTRSSTSASA